MKYFIETDSFETLFVVPLAGTWVEIFLFILIPGAIPVVPLAGTWVEIPFRPMM